MSSVAAVTRQIAALEISGKNKTTSTSARPPLHSKQPSQTNVAKLLTKFSAPNAPSKITKTTSSSTLRTQTPSGDEKAPAKQASAQIDIGSYDGGLELDNEKRGEAVTGEAAKELALDSSSAR